MADILDMACRKRRLTTSKEFALLLEDLTMIVPLDRTVASLQGRSSLVVMKKTLIETLGPELARKPGRSSDPNGASPSCVVFFGVSVLLLLAMMACFRFVVSLIWFRSVLLLSQDDMSHPTVNAPPHFPSRSKTPLIGTVGCSRMGWGVCIKTLT